MDRSRSPPQLGFSDCHFSDRYLILPTGTFKSSPILSPETRNTRKELRQ